MTKTDFASRCQSDARFMAELEFESELKIPRCMIPHNRVCKEFCDQCFVSEPHLPGPSDAQLGASARPLQSRTSYVSGPNPTDILDPH